MNDKFQGQGPAELAELRADLPDWYLQALVKTVDERDIELPVTLFVGGLVVFGQLTSSHKYFAGLRTQLAGSLGGSSEIAAEVARHSSSQADLYADIYTTQGDAGNETSPIQYIHLRAARIFMSGQHQPSNEGAWWRGRLTRVDGFQIGVPAIAEPAA